MHWGIGSESLQYESDNTIIVADPFITVDGLADKQEQFVNLHDVLAEELDSEQDDVVSQNSQSTEENSDCWDVKTWRIQDVKTWRIQDVKTWNCNEEMANPLFIP